MSAETRKYCIALVDDNIDFLSDAKNHLLQLFAKESKHVVIDGYDNELAFWWKMQENNLKYNLYILDVNLPNKTGLDLAREIRKRDEWHPILFLTDYEWAAVESYQVNACNYVLKTGYKQKLDPIVLKCYQIWEKEEKDYYRYFYKGKFKLVSCRDIEYLQYDANERLLTIKTGTEELKERKSLAAVLNELKKDYFMITARGIAVNLLHVVGAEDGVVHLLSGAEVLLSSKYKKEFFAKIAQVIGDDTFGRI